MDNLYQREVNNGLAMAHFKSSKKDQNCDRAEQQRLVEQMASLDTCRARNLVYGSFHPLQNPPMFSVSYPPSLTGIITEFWEYDQFLDVSRSACAGPDAVSAGF